MLRLLEELLLNFAELLFTSSTGMVLLCGVGITLVFLQFTRTGNGVSLGLAGIGCGLLGVFNMAAKDKISANLSARLSYINSSHSNLGDVPIIEPVFRFFITKSESRFLWEEILFVLIFVYAFSVLRSSVKSYKESGKFYDKGELSITSVFQKKSARPVRSKHNELGSGDLATNDEILRWTKPSGLGDTYLEVTNLRGSQGIAAKSAKLILPKGERNRHVLAVAKTGSGKTTQLILPFLYSDCMDPTRSTIVIDSKPEMWKKLAGMTRKYNPDKQILLFNPLDTIRSMSWNILAKIKDDTDCKLIANTLIMATDQPSAKADSPFFRNNALAILNAIMVGLLRDQEKGLDVLSMPRVHSLVQSGIKNLCSWLEVREDAVRTTRTFIELARSGSQNADTIMSELSMRISAWDIKPIRATTDHNEIDLQLLIDKPTLFIIEFRESELEMLRPMANVIVIELLRFLTKSAETCPGITLPRPVGLVIDEFASALGQLPDIHVKLNTLRSRNVSITAAIQSTSQVKANYGDHADSVLAGFSTKIFMPALDLVDSEWASKESGQMTIRFKTASVGSNKKTFVEFFASKNDSTQEQVQQRAVLTPDEIGRPSDNIATIFMPNTPVFQCFLTPYYKIPEMRDRIMEFDRDDNELKVRDTPIEYQEISAVTTTTTTSAASGGLPSGITNTAGWTDDQVIKKLDETKAKLDWQNTTGSAKKWWEAFESENQHRKALILRLAEELSNRKATITEFFLAYVYSNTENIQANLHYLDYTRLKKEEERRKKEASQKAMQSSAAA